MFNIDQYKDIQKRIQALYTYLEIEQKRIQVTNDEEKTASPDFWDDPKKAEMFMKELRSIKKWIEDYESVEQAANDLEVLIEFNKEGEVSDEEVQEHYSKTIKLLENIEFKNMLSDEGDNLSLIHI